ncbi:MAG: hypothetical protein K2Q18_03170 [Bdellovibrionales bacterium]|nr:hypothetical protein [Bdellovibrionales bacterium]
MKNSWRFIFLFSSLLVVNSAFAFDNYKFSPTAESTFPLFVGGGLKMSAYEKLDIGISYGVTPKPYYQVIGSASAHFGDDPDYKEIIKAAFQDNSQWRAHWQYNFQGKTGWNFGTSGAKLESSGKASIDKVLGAINGKDYTQLKNLLTALGKSTDVSMDSDLTIGEIFGGYTWSLGHSFYGQVTLGVAKVLSADVKIKTGLPNYEASANGSALLRSTESDLENIITENGITPTLGLKVSYEF